jgi:F-type H+-transporting ATPase subunit a
MLACLLSLSIALVAQPQPASPAAEPVPVPATAAPEATEGALPRESASLAEPAEHGTSVAGTIFHHVRDEPGWVRFRPVLGGEEVNLDIGKHVVSMWIAAVLLALLCVIAAGRRALIPKGLYNFVESFVAFIRDEIAVKNIGEHGARAYTPYLCSAFFFILFMNLLGLVPIPGIGTATGNISVTMVLASFTFLLTQIAGMKSHGVVGYWAHLVPAGVPAWLYPIMVPVEILGLFAKPFALTIRLFANMLAGHIVVYFLIGLTVILTPFIAPVSVVFALAIYMLEIFVALVQAYIFTILSALFIGMAGQSH